MRAANLEGKIIDSVLEHGTDYSFASFRGSRLVNSLFLNCDFSFTDFEGAEITDSDFYDCNFTSAYLKKANLRGSVFSACTVDGMDMSDSLLSNVDMPSKYYPMIDFSGCRCQNLYYGGLGEDGGIYHFKGMVIATAPKGQDIAFTQNGLVGIIATNVGGVRHYAFNSGISAPLANRDPATVKPIFFKLVLQIEEHPDTLDSLGA